MTLEDLEKRVELLEHRVTSLEDKGSKGDVAKRVKQQTIGEFVIESGAKSYNEKTCAIASYMEKFREKKSFTSEDITQGYRDARESLPKNVSDTVKACAQKKWFSEINKNAKTGAKEYQLTNTGAKAVEYNFNHKKTK
jgi:hypothetical protein